MTEERQNAINSLKETTNIKTSPKEKDEFYKQKLKYHEQNTENPDIVGILHWLQKKQRHMD